MNPSISPGSWSDIQIRWMNWSLLRRPNSPFFPHSLYPRHRFLQLVKWRHIFNNSPSVWCASGILSFRSNRRLFHTRTDSRCWGFFFPMVHACILYCRQLSCLLIWPGKRGPNTGVCAEATILLVFFFILKSELRSCFQIKKTFTISNEKKNHLLSKK